MVWASEYEYSTRMAKRMGHGMGTFLYVLVFLLMSSIPMGAGARGVRHHGGEGVLDLEYLE